MPKINEEKKRLNNEIILKYASELFYRDGYNKTSVNDIIKNAKISKGMFYTYFDSKEDLFFHIIHRIDSEIRDSDIKFTALEKYIEFRLKRFCDIENRIRAKYTIEFWSSASLDDMQKKLFQNRYDAFQNDIISIIEYGQERGIYKQSIPVKTFVHIMMSSLDGIIMMDSVLNQRITEEVIQTTVAIFSSYLIETEHKS